MNINMIINKKMNMKMNMNIRTIKEIIILVDLGIIIRKIKNQMNKKKSIRITTRPKKILIKNNRTILKIIQKIQINKLIMKQILNRIDKIQVN